MTTNTINTLADIKPWQDRTPSSLKYYMAASGPSVFMQHEITDLRAYAEKQEERIAELEAKHPSAQGVEALAYAMHQSEYGEFGVTIEAFRDGDDYEFFMKMARVAASQVEAEPVATVHVYRGGADGVCVYFSRENRDRLIEAGHGARLYLAAQPPAPAAPDKRLDDLRMLVGRLVRALHKAAPANTLGAQAMDYLDRVGLKSSPLRDAAVSSDIAEGFKQAAALIAKKAEDYINENASHEPDTNAVVFHYGEAGSDYYNNLVELAEEINAAAPAGNKAVLSRCDAGASDSAPLTDDQIAQIYKEAFESELGCARSAPSCPPLVIKFARAAIAAAQEGSKNGN